MTKEQLQILQHSLGADQYGRRERYNDRNHYVTDNDAEMEPLVALGYMRCDGSNTATGHMNCYRVTDAGIKAMREESPNPPKLTPSQKRYREWLKIGDALNCSFGEWLKMRKEPWYKEMEAGG
jgi:hypothetical protein